MLLRDYGRERLQSTGSGKSVRLVAAKGRRSAGGRPVVYRPPVCRAVERLWAGIPIRTFAEWTGVEPGHLQTW